MKRIFASSGVLAAVVVVSMAMAGTASADIPFGQPINGNSTYYNDAGYGACGTQIDASSQLLVAVSYTYWTTANPNDDPLCQGVSVQVSYNGTTITVPVEDKCPSCDSGHIDLSQPAFAELADTGLGNIPVTWEFVHS
ncbi:MAG TPA: cysteine/serine endopeptidase inhibitor [Pseudonocardiaceae bacterium]|jgi:expansin (peptidoglycan-binding protein)|nr:cysteine/serine endopeptidase inhibitor [Pseudonocardiaceae bacterium]